MEGSRKRYVCGIFADIKGAFDNAWHTAILRQLYLWGCSPGLIRLVVSYLKERRVTLTVGGGVAEKVVSKGCPQGSILGPLLWNVLFNGLLELDMGGVEVVAYADDAVVIVDAETRNDVERRLVDVAERLWTENIKLTLSLEKTVVMKLKENKVNKGKAQRKSDRKRKLVVRVRGRRLENVTEVKYLGVWIGEGMRCDRHVAEIGTKVIDLVGMFAREMRVEWGLSSRTLYKLYRLVIQPGMLSGVEFWGEEMLRRRVIRDRWNAVQRRVVIKMISAYRTVSGDAVCVVAGVEPFDLKVEMSMNCGRDVSEGISRVESVERRQEEMVAAWQARWELSSKGRTTFEYIRQVSCDGHPNWKLDHYVTQGLTGHGNFKDKLCSFGLIREGLCDVCRIEETAEHVVLICEKFEEERNELKGKVMADGEVWCKEVLMSNDRREEFFRMIKKILKRKEEMDEMEGDEE